MTKICHISCFEARIGVTIGQRFVNVATTQQSTVAVKKQRFARGAITNRRTDQ